MKIANTFKNAASVEMAWFNALTKAKQDGYTHLVTAIDYQNTLQKHYFKSLQQADKFITDITGNPCWKKIGNPQTITNGLKQCWS